MLAVRLACASLVSLLLATAASAQVPPDADAVLRQAGFTAGDFAAVEQGKAVARAASGRQKDELLVFAAVKIRATREQTASYYARLVTWVDGDVTLSFGRFSNPPVLADVQDLSLPPSEIAGLRACRAGSCDFKIGGQAISAFQESIDWTAPDAAERVNALLRERAVRYVADYLQRGNAALVTYRDGAKPVSLTEVWKDLLDNAPYLRTYAPALRTYLADFPAGALPGGRDVVYWIMEKYPGLKPVLSLVHAVILDDPAQPGRTSIVQKQIYASHYYEGSLAVASIVSAPASAEPATYVIYANRSRGDLLKGGFGGLKRTLARDQAKKGAQQTLEAMKSALEK